MAVVHVTVSVYQNHKECFVCARMEKPMVPQGYVKVFLHLCLLKMSGIYILPSLAPTTFLVFSEGRRIRGFTPSETTNTVHEAFPPITTTGLPVAVDYNGVDQRVYWTDVDNGTIVASTLHGQTTVVLGGLVDPRGLAVDWITSNVFFSDAGLQQIGVTSADGTYSVVIVNNSLDQPGNIVLNPIAGYFTHNTILVVLLSSPCLCG